MLDNKNYTISKILISIYAKLGVENAFISPGSRNTPLILALSDQTDKNMGGFQCIPWLYRNYENWKLNI